MNELTWCQFIPLNLYMERVLESNIFSFVYRLDSRSGIRFFHCQTLGILGLIDRSCLHCPVRAAILQSTICRFLDTDQDASVAVFRSRRSVFVWVKVEHRAPRYLMGSSFSSPPRDPFECNFAFLSLLMVSEFKTLKPLANLSRSDIAVWYRSWALPFLQLEMWRRPLWIGLLLLSVSPTCTLPEYDLVYSIHWSPVLSWRILKILSSHPGIPCFQLGLGFPSNYDRPIINI